MSNILPCVCTASCTVPGGLSLTCRDISGIPGGDFLEFGSIVHLELKMSWLDFGEQMSLWTHKTGF